MKVAKWIAALLLLSGAALGETIQHTKIWNAAIITGPLTADGKFRYYLQPRLGLIDDKYKYEHFQFLIGGGYQWVPNLTGWLLYGYTLSESTHGNIRQINTIREQLSWTILNNDNINFSNTSRLEERKENGETTWSLRAREMLTARLPIKCWKNHSVILFDEVFFNLNHPAWINSNTFLEQNRIFIGIGTQFTSTMILDIGYMNQYQRHTSNNIKSNILYAALNITN